MLHHHQLITALVSHKKVHIRSSKSDLALGALLFRGHSQERNPVRRGGCLHGRAVQEPPGRGVFRRGRRRRRHGGWAVDAVRRRRVQPVPDRLPLPRLLPRSRRRHPAVPPPLVHHRHRGRALRARDAGNRPLPLHGRPRGAHQTRVCDQVWGPVCQEGSRTRDGGAGEAVH